MALLVCPECGNQVSEHAGFCPKCGCKIEYIINYHKNVTTHEKQEPQIIIDEEDDKDIKQSPAWPKRLNHIYHFIMWEMNGFDYKASDEDREFAKAVKQFLLDTANSQVKRGELRSPTFACSVKTIYGKHLSWNRNTWRKSAETIYRYYKANALVCKIQEYERVFGETLMRDKTQMMEFLYDSLCKGDEIDYDKAPGITTSFSLVPADVLNNILNDFYNRYEK